MTDHEMQSQGLVAQRNRLFCDLKTDEEKASFFLSGRGYESGVIAHSIQNDVAMAYQRCSEYRKEMKDLQAENERLRCIISDIKEWDCDRCPHGVRRPHECKECADTVPASEALDWAEREFAVARQSPGEPGQVETTVKDLMTEQPAPDVTALVDALQGLLNIVSDSSGVADYHLNGSIADWDEFEEVENAEVVLSAHRKQGEKP